MNTRFSITHYRGEYLVTGQPSMFADPRCFTFAVVAIGVGAAGIGLSAYEYASQPGAPKQPNLASASQAVSNTNAALLPFQRGLQAAQQTGGKYTFNLPQGVSADSLGIKSGAGQGWYDSKGNLVSSDQNYGQTVLSSLQNPDVLNTGAPLNPETQAAYQQWLQQNGINPNAYDPNNPYGAQQGSPYLGYGLQQPAQTTTASGASFDPTAGLTWKPGSSTIGGVPITQNADGSYTIDFKGISQADIQAQQAQQTAADQLALSQQYDPQFISAALQEQQEADPGSVAARQEMSDLIQQQINHPLGSPVSDMMNQQVQDTLDAAKNDKLTSVDEQRLNDAVSQALAQRGGSGTPGNFEAPLTTGFAGEQRQANAAQGAMGFLASGSDPEDIAYRREQQNLANLSAEINGQTPESEFASMSGAQSGPTPMISGAQLPTMPSGQAQGAMQTAIQNAQTQNRFNSTQANPWMAGLSSLINVGGAAGNLGFQPFAPAS